MLPQLLSVPEVYFGLIAAILPTGDAEHSTNVREAAVAAATSSAAV